MASTTTGKKHTTGPSCTQFLSCVGKQCPEYGDVFSVHMLRKGKHAFNYKKDGLKADHPYSEITYWSVEEMEYICIGDLLKAKRIEDNIAQLNFVPADIDEYTTEENVCTPLDKLGLEPHVTETSSHIWGSKFQLLFELEEPATPKLFELWDLVQDGLFRMLRAYGLEPDMSILGDKTRFVRNPYGRNRKNLKYDHKPDVRLIRRGKPISLSVMYRILKNAGFIVQPKRSKPRKSIPFRESFKRVRKFFGKEQRIECTQKELAFQLDIPYRTIQFILAKLEKRGEIVIQWTGNNKAGNKRRCIFTSHISETLDKGKRINTTRPPTQERVLGYSVLDSFKGVCVEKRQRNAFTFLAALEYRHTRDSKISPEELLALLRNSYDYEDLDTFSEDEMLKAIKSAFSERYLFPISEARLRDPGGPWSKCFKGVLHA